MTEELDDRSAQTGCGCEPQMPSRRNFIRTVAITAATLVVMPATFASADNVPVTWIDLGAQPEPTTTWTKFILPDAYNGETIFIRKVVPEAGSASMIPIYQAISARCTHRHCVVAFDSDAVTFDCPCHGAKFDSNSYPIQGPAKTALPPLLCQWSKGHLIVEAPNPSSTTQTD
jgi:Rieske Fe-S protein